MQHLTRRLDATPPQMRRTVAMALLLRLARPLRHATTRRLPTRLYSQDVRPGADYVPLTPEELIPKSPEMVARATRVKEEHPERFVTPADAAEMVRKGAALIDVRTEQQVLEHEVREGVPALTAKNARRIALDNWVIAGGPPPMLGGGGRIVVCTCTAGPKSALAVEYLLQFGVDAVAVAGGLKGWDAGGLELVDLFEEDEDDEDEDEDE